LAAGKWVLALGGDHSVSYPLIKAHQNSELAVLQLDAHGDLYPGYQDSIYSHAAPMYRLIQDGFRLVQAGQRVLSRAEQDLIRAKEVPFFSARSLHQHFDPERIVATLPEQVYITLDLDVLDPSQMPSVGTPLPGGLSYLQIMAILNAVFSARQVVGMDIVEFSPSGDFHAAMTAAQIAYEAMGLLGRARGWPV
jgi:agmatinase